ncbi:hypothetical protein HBI56_187850 [Parastagonospora nodorum]|uniref:Uncharacterized protein n=1 Tax=Phaeosphaeria nodorum (strain SN15 / ATCC MYA-4574 / FGSC 10173) TaxID=321614 RepID=A0A7U2IAN5_PHANO|nr:hypothetical protein HBH56_161670 [Parastagonospora nodorum]QRD06352.1 hypothetical protein JI435_423260 [Parastagonospora nodorum SN15]KAH3932019.1 hypothetical protein HBH54_087570 [Parastagonospora nodorum]KAH3947470.1 hypothetical protein HBH53_114800 [Parastagonospora nodorum]KAH3972743.1 hypothetical protein HBH51_102230 [Parastagonospora nodorum]
MVHNARYKYVREGRVMGFNSKRDMTPREKEILTVRCTPFRQALPFRCRDIGKRRDG